MSWTVGVKEERMVREILLVHGKTDKIPLKKVYAGKDEDGEETFLDIYDYEEDYKIRKRLCRKKLREHIMRKGYTEKQADEIILDCVVRGVIDRISVEDNRDMEEFILANEEHWVEMEVSSLWGIVEEYMNLEVKDYVLEDAFNWDDKDEEKIREVFHEHNTKHLTRQQLTEGLAKKGYTPQEAQKLIENYTTQERNEEEEPDWWLNTAEYIFKRPEYKPLRHHEERIIFHGEYNYTTMPDCLEIMQPEEWLLSEYSNLIHLRYDRWYIHGTQNIPFRKIREILRRNEEQQGRSTPHTELKKELMRECGASEDEAEMAIYAALRTFKIRENTTHVEEDGQPEEPEYYWSGTTGIYPPLTLQDRVLNPIKKVFMEAEKQGKTTLTKEELVERALQAYKEYDEKEPFSETYTTKIDTEYTQTMIEEAEELLLIKPVQGGYQLNKPALENLTGKNPKKRSKTKTNH